VSVVIFGINLSFRRDGPWMAVAIAFILGFVALFNGDETVGYVFVAIGLILGVLLLDRDRRKRR
jgi:ElaB/YqjD/DUF883 family membrane-anchored ribosome-binding protein